MKIKNCDNCSFLSSFYDEWYSGLECTKGHEIGTINCEEWFCEDEANKEFDEWIEQEAIKEGWKNENKKEN